MESAGSAGQLGCGPGGELRTLNWSKGSGAGDEGRISENSGKGGEG